MVQIKKGGAFKFLFMWIVNRYACTKAMLKCRSNPIKLPIIQYTKCNGYKAFGCRLIDTQSDFEPFKNLQRSITPEENTLCIGMYVQLYIPSNFR